MNVKKLKRIWQQLKNYYHLLVALAANIYYGFPSRRLRVIGITGTDGKTTTTHLIYHILSAAGKKVSMVSTVYAKIGDTEHETGLHTTTPDPFLVQKLVREAVDHGDEYLVLETTSHALDQNRVWGVEYFISILTNITHEHLDYHLDYDDYLKTKAIMLLRSETAVINADDRSTAKLVSILQGRKLLTYGLVKPADYHENYAKITGLNLTDFNQYNYLAAAVVAKQLGIGEDDIVKAMKTYRLPPGRMEMVHRGRFDVLVDFAHTPNAIDVLLKSLKRMRKGKPGRIIHVFGSAGLRDASKRGLMGEASGRWADRVILTEEDYRIEDPEAICRAIAGGLEKQGFSAGTGGRKTYEVVIDRHRALEKAIGEAGEGDIVAVTGKGHEKSLCRGKTEYPWNDIDAVRDILKP